MPLSTSSFLDGHWAEFLCLKHLTPAWILQSEEQTQSLLPPNTGELGQPVSQEGAPWAAA